MKRAKNITVTVYDSTGGSKAPVAWIEPSLYKPKNTIAVAHIRRKRDAENKVVKGDGAGWEMKIIDKSIDVKQGDRDDFLLKRSEEHTSELQSLMRISYAVFCLKKKNNQNPETHKLA